MSYLLERIQKIEEDAKKLQKGFGDVYKNRSFLESIILELLALCEEEFREDRDLISELRMVSNQGYSSDERYIDSQRRNAEIYNQKKVYFLRTLFKLKTRAELRERKQKENRKGVDKRVKIAEIKKEEIFSRAEDFLKKATRSLEKAEEEKDCADSIQESIKSIEYSLKTVFILILNKYPETHNFQDETSKQLFSELNKRMSKEMLFVMIFANLGRLFFLPHFWSESYNYTKYGGIYGTSKIVYHKEESQLAISHAKEELSLAQEVYSLRDKKEKQNLQKKKD